MLDSKEMRSNEKHGHRYGCLGLPVRIVNECHLRWFELQKPLTLRAIDQG